MAGKPLAAALWLLKALSNPEERNGRAEAAAAVTRGLVKAATTSLLWSVRKDWDEGSWTRRGP